DVVWLSGIYIRNLERSGAELIRSRAVIEDRHTIRILADGRRVTAQYILVATGGWPALDRTVPGIERAVSSNEMFDLKTLPRRLLVVGGGYIAVEFAGVFNAFGVETTVVHRGAEILRGFDGDIRRSVRAGMQGRGVSVVCNDTVASIEKDGDGIVGVTRHGRRIPADVILYATGRHPNSSGFGLAETGVAMGGRGE
ncbi:MAG: FAD-dependent oxidoreductase, partial [Candidatus Eremiobacteraeota bacterium]|nr:FAD-dependent oxidoreductase [Candidatus Eremiobacteraeota bacterium]